MATDRPTWTVRHATHDDEPFIAGAWLRSYRDKCPAAARISNDTYYGANGQRAVIESVLYGVPDAGAVVVEFAGELLGFAVSFHHGLEYVYVKQAYRRLGVARTMIEQFNFDSLLPLAVSHITNAGALLLDAMKIQFFYDPYKWRTSK